MVHNVLITVGAGNLARVIAAEFGGPPARWLARAEGLAG